MNDATRPKSDRTWLYIGLAFAGLWAVYLAFFNPRSRDESIPAPSLADVGIPLPADYAWPLEDLDGNPVSFETFRGKPVVLNLWATWCGPCRAEMPSLVRLAANPRLKAVAFVCVTGEPASASVKRFAQTEMAGLTVFRADGVPRVFETQGIPATFIIGADGKIKASEVGSARWDDPTVVAFLEKLIASSPAPKL